MKCLDLPVLNETALFAGKLFHFEKCIYKNQEVFFKIKKIYFFK